MPIKTFDDETGTEIVGTEGLQVVVMTTSGPPTIRYYTSWAAIPKALLAGLDASAKVTGIVIQPRDQVAVNRIAVRQAREVTA